MKLIILVVTIFMLAGCGTGAASLFRIIPADSNVCPHGNNVFTNQCNN